MSDEKPTIKLKFAPLVPATDENDKPREQSPVVEIANGEYHRRFEAKDQPFEVTGFTRVELDEAGKERVDSKNNKIVTAILTPAEEAHLLLNTGHFVVVEETAAPAKAQRSKEIPPESTPTS